MGISIAVTMFKSTPKKTPIGGPAFYAEPSFLKRPAFRDWWTLLHPPYTLMNLSLVVIGSCLRGPVNAVRLTFSVVAFFLAVGVGAHALDELHGRPLSTTIPTWQLVTASSLGVGGAVILGIVGLFIVSAYLAIFIVVGVVIALSYNLELFQGRLHTGIVLTLGWGAFPVLTAYFAQHANLSISVVLASAFAALVTQVQRKLSSPARDIRRRTASIEGIQVLLNGETRPITSESILAPLESSLRALCLSTMALALAFLFLRFL
ncbi:MAG TPA: hypothetical protein VIJ40_02680 [Acidimicrobiales bacterium]